MQLLSSCAAAILHRCGYLWRLSLAVSQVIEACIASCGEAFVTGWLLQKSGVSLAQVRARTSTKQGFLKRF